MPLPFSFERKLFTPEQQKAFTADLTRIMASESQTEAEELLLRVFQTILSNKRDTVFGVHIKDAVYYLNEWIHQS